MSNVLQNLDFNQERLIWYVLHQTLRANNISYQPLLINTHIELTRQRKKKLIKSSKLVFQCLTEKSIFNSIMVIQVEGLPRSKDPWKHSLHAPEPSNRPPYSYSLLFLSVSACSQFVFFAMQRWKKRDHSF